MTCPGTPHRGHRHEDEPCHIVDARGMTDEKPGVDDVLIQRFFSAMYRGRCALNDEHRIAIGDPVGRAVEKDDLSVVVGTVCQVCVQEMTG